MYLITRMQAQAWFNQLLPALPPVLLPPMPFLEGGVSCGVFSGGAEEASTTGTGGSAGAAVAASAGGSTVLALASWEDTCTDAVFVTNLRDKGLAAGFPPEQDFLRML